MTDDQLAMEAKQGNKAAMELLVLRYYDEIHAYAARRTGSTEIARDIAQITFEKLVRALPHYRLTGKFRPWLFTIAANAANDYFRRRPMESPLPEELKGNNDILRLLVQKEEYRRVRQCILNLPDNQRDAVILFYYHDISIKDIASITGANENTVKSRLRLGMGKLRTALEVENDEKQMG